MHIKLYWQRFCQIDKQGEIKNEGLSTFSEDKAYNQKDAEGFINLFGLPLKTQALMKMMAGLEKEVKGEGA